MTDPARPRPIITANQVTTARLVLLPLGTFLLYQGTRAQWIALVAMTIVGCTDFVDGWLARKYGPTVLGGLMDPIADKMFIALTMLPALDLGWFPVSIVTLIFFREFVITAARTAYSRREVTLKTSYLAKVKTWFQMVSVGLIFLWRISYPSLVFVFTVCTVAPIVGGLVFYAVRRKVWRGAIAFAASFLVFRTVAWVATPEAVAQLIMWSTVLITWASGGAYLFGIRDLPGTARFDAHDAVRLFGAVSLPVLAALLIGGAHSPVDAGWEERYPSWPVFTTVALEFAIGGLDNLLAYQKRLADWRYWLLRVGLQAALLGGALSAAGAGRYDLAGALAFSALAVTVIATVKYFWWYRRAYLDEEPSARPAAA